MIWKGLAAAAVLATSGAAQATWQEASSKHFVVYANDTPDKLRAFTAKLERFDKAMRALRGLDDPAVSPTQRVSVYVLDDQGDIAKLYGRGGDGVAGFYNARASGPVAFVPRKGDGGGKFALTPQQVLFHEYAHHLMYSTMGGYYFPAWYVEGFAEFSATADVQDDGSVVFGAVPMYRLYGIANLSPMTAKALLTANPQRLPADQRETVYGRGWLLTHYLTVDEGRRKQLADYLHALNQGKPAAQAAAALDLPTLDRRLAGYTHEKLRGFTVPARILTVGEVTLRTLTPGEAAVMPARLLSTRGVNPKTAPRVVALAKRLAAPFPNDPGAQNVLAEAEFDAGDPQAALAAADRALAADPRSLHAMAYRGLALQAIALKTEGKDAPAAFKRARAAFVAANRADHDAPWPLELNYLSYLAPGHKPSPNAEDGLLQAAALAPYDDDLSLLAAKVLLERDKPGEATPYLRPLASNPHGGVAALFASKLLTLIDAGDKAGAHALFATEPVKDAAGKEDK